MIRSLSEEEQVALGLNNVSFGQEEFLALPADLAGYGRGRTLAAVTLAALATRADFSPTYIKAAEHVTARLEICATDPHVVKVIDDTGGDVLVRSARPSGEWEYRDPNDPSTVFMDLSHVTVATVTMADGRGIVMGLEGGTLFLAEFYPQRDAARPLGEVRAPLTDWAADCDDTWLTIELVRRGKLADSWEHAVGVGLYARFYEPPIHAVRATAERLLAGHVDDAILRPRRWARVVSSDELATLETLALAVMGRAAKAIGELQEAMSPSEQSWQDALFSVCTERDDLECIRLLLVEAKAGQRVTAGLDTLDRQGRSLLASIPGVISFPDERLMRAKLADPEAWWTAFAAMEAAV